MSKNSEGLSIGTLARAADVSVQTIRYYERRGLLPQPARRASGYRVYAAETVTRLRFIRRAQALGFTLAEVAELLGLRVDAETSCEQVQRQLSAKLSEIETKMRMLQEMQRALTTMAAACEQGGPHGTCPVLSALAEGESESGHASILLNQ